MADFQPREKEVYFGNYCARCIHWDLEEHEDPCHECLNNPVNLGSVKPVKFEEKQ